MQSELDTRFATSQTTFFLSKDTLSCLFHRIPFIFHATHLLTPEEAKIADTISSHWINFAYDGSPGQDFPEVPKLVVYGKDRVKVEEDNYRSEEMEFWARLFADRAAGKVAN